MKIAKFLLQEKLNANFEKYRALWLRADRAELIDNCGQMAEIAGIAKNLASILSDEEAECLLCFQNPLEVVSEGWITVKGPDYPFVADEMRQLVQEMLTQGDLESYEMIVPMSFLKEEIVGLSQIGAGAEPTEARGCPKFEMQM